MKIIALPDIHGGGIAHFNAITDILASVDVILLPGDLTNGAVNEAKAIIESLRKFKASILAVPGNWDNTKVSQYLTDEGVNIDRQNIRVNDVVFAGVGGGMPFLKFGNELSDDKFALHLAESVNGLHPGELHVLVCHQPPFDTINDLTHFGGRHVGSKSVREFIERFQPLVCFTGHIHEGQGIDSIGRTKIVNPGPLFKRSYAYAEIENGEIITLDICKF